MKTSIFYLRRLLFPFKSLFSLVFVILIAHTFPHGNVADFFLKEAQAFDAIPLTIKERSGVQRVDEPVSYAIPFAIEDNVLSISSLGVADHKGSTVETQFNVISRYHGTPSDTSKPIRMVLLNFLVSSINGNQELTYTLYGKGNGSSSGLDLVSENSTHFTINTGVLTAKISKSNFNLFDEVMLGTEQIVSSNEDDGIILNHEGTEYTSNNPPTEMVIEQNGPLKAVLKVKGYLKNSGLNTLTPSLGDNGISYTVRFKIFKDKSYIKVDFSFENENQGWSYTASDPVHNIWVRSIILKTTLNSLTGSKIVSFDGYADSFLSGNYELLQTENSDGTTPSYDWSYILEKDSTEVGSGQKYDAFADIRDADNGLMVASRWFWQNHPKGVSINNNVMRFMVLPDTGTEHRILGGIWKTTELIYYFHDENDTNFDDEVATLKKRLVARAPGSHFAATSFFSAMVPESIQSDYTFPAGEELQEVLDVHVKAVRSKYDLAFSDDNDGETLFSLRTSRNIKLTDTIYGTWYGWLEFGDFVRGNGWGYSATHYGWPYVSLKNFLRFDDYNALDMAEELVSHAADISIVHDPHATEAMDSQYHGGHRYENDALLSYDDTHSHGTNAPRFSSHFWNRGIILQYLLTGDRRYYDAAQDTAEHFKKVYVDDFQCRPDASDDTRCPLADSLRAKGRAVQGLINFYMASGETSHLENAWNIFKYGVLQHRKTYFHNGETYVYYSDSPSTDKLEYSALQSGINVEGAIEMHEIYTHLGNSARASEIAEFIRHNSEFVRDIIYTSWVTADCGTYGTGGYAGQYFPYGQKKLWDPEDEWDDNEICKNCGNYGNYYALYLADMFAFQYRQTGKMQWLNLARAVFKDFYFYTLSAGYYDIAFEPRDINGFNNLANAWAKYGQRYKKGMYYLKTEWQESLGNIPCVPDCSDKVCGSDGCGGICDSCPSRRRCNSHGLCSSTILFYLPYLHREQKEFFGKIDTM